MQIDFRKTIGYIVYIRFILTKQRRLTLPMIRRLEAGLGIPAAVLIQAYEIERQVA